MAKMKRGRFSSISSVSATTLLVLFNCIGCGVSVSSAQAPESAKRLVLVVAGDGRADPSAKPPRPGDSDGINVEITREIRNAILAEHASALMWTGDLVYGDREGLPSYRSQLKAWVDMMKPLWDRGIKVLVVRGNHEARSVDSIPVWNEVFSGSFALPQTGPEGAKNLTYWVVIQNVLILGIDQYTFADELSPVAWVNDTLHAHKQPHVFAFGHEMAFMAGHHKDNLSVNAKNRDDFMNALIGGGSQAFFAGHDHFYDHMVAKGENGSIQQFVAGTAGAPKYVDNGYVQSNPGWATERVSHAPQSDGDPIVYGYLLIEIDGLAGKITFKGRNHAGHYEPMDSWSYVAK